MSARLSRLDAIPWLAPALAALLIVAVLAPVRESALRFDDARVIVENRSAQIVEDRSAFEQVGHDVHAMVVDQGRPQPLGVVFGTLLSIAFPERAAYKLALIVLTLACIALVVLLLRRLGTPRASLPFVAVAVAGGLQFRGYHDPVLGYYGTTQVSLLLLLGGLLAYLHFLRGGGVRWFALAFALAALLVASYEVNYPLVAAFACLHLGRDPRRVRGLRWSTPLLGLGAVMVLVAAVTHSNASVVASGYDTSLDLIAVTQATLRQLFAPIPSIYFISGGDGLLASPTSAEALGAVWRAGTAAALVALLALGFRHRATVDTGPEPSHASASRTDDGPVQEEAIAGIGVVLVAGSVVLVSLASKYQTEIPLGRGYLPTLLQTAGLVMLATAAWTRWGARLSATRVPLLATVTVVGAVVLMTEYTNLRVIAADLPARAQRDLVEGALERGLVDDLPDRATLFYSGRDFNWPRTNVGYYPGTLDSLVLTESDRRVDVRSYPPTAPACLANGRFPVDDCAPTGPTTSWLAVRGHRFGGSAIRADVARGDDALKGLAARIVVLARGTSASAGPSLAGYTADGDVWTPQAGRWRRRALDDGWVRFETTDPGRKPPVAASLIDPRSTIDFAAGENLAATVRLFGTKKLLP